MAVTLNALADIPMIEPGDDLVSIIGDSVASHVGAVATGDVVVIAQKIVSKAEGRYVLLDRVQVTDAARDLAERIKKDPRRLQVVLSESAGIVAHRPGIVIAEHRLGFVMANAGIDESNVDHSAGERLLLLPEDPDRSAREIRQGLEARFGCRLGVVISDSFGRPWRNGVVGVAIGCAGVEAVRNLVGTHDMFGRQMQVTEVAVADEIASAASMLMGQGAERLPVVHIRGLAAAGNAPASSLIRPKERDMFRTW